MPTKNTKIITLRVPERVDFGEINIHKLVTNLYDLVACGALEIRDNEIDLPEFEDNGWGEIEDICHERNIDIRDAQRKIRQILWR